MLLFYVSCFCAESSSQFWHPGSILTQPNNSGGGAVSTEARNCKAQVSAVWSSNPANDKSNALVFDDGFLNEQRHGQLSSSTADTSLKLFQGFGREIETQSFTPWPSFTGSAAENSQLSNTGIGLEVCKKFENSGGSGLRLFGFELMADTPISMEEKLVHATAIATGMMDTNNKQIAFTKQSSSELKPRMQHQIYPNEILSKQSCCSSTRSRTKVHMQGIVVGRAVDLTILESYEELITELEKMFDIKEGELQHRNKWELVYTDDEDDMMLVGDDPWL